MSTKPKEEALAATAARPQKFTVERLRKDCFSLFGVTTSTYDGATYGVAGEFSVADMRAIIDKWKNKGVFSPKNTEKEVE